MRTRVYVCGAVGDMCAGGTHIRVGVVGSMCEGNTYPCGRGWGYVCGAGETHI